VGVGERPEAPAREAIAALGRLVRVSGGADRDGLVLPRSPRKLAAEHLDDVDLDADRLTVTVVERAVGPTLEGPHVAERAAMDAAHVGVERPVEHHPLDAVEGALAGLLAVFGTHTPIIRTCVRVCGGRKVAS
jgi:hypothetical protein